MYFSYLLQDLHFYLNYLRRLIVMKIEERFVALDNASEIFHIIEDVLRSNPDTQVYVSKELIHEFNHNSAKHHIFSFNGLKTYHYNVDDDNFGGEDWYGLTTGSFFASLICSASFITNCDGYQQLVEFKSKNVKEYIHFCSGFKQLLLIEVKK